MFQSLFCWKLLWKTMASQVGMECLTVSILILLEIALEARGNARALGKYCRFNPYSAGNCSGRNKCGLIKHWARIVSILILLEIALEVIEEGQRMAQKRGFQSLFCWKLLWKIWSLSFCSVDGRRFNPYSAGNCSGSVFTDTSAAFSTPVSILILLEIALEDYTFYPRKVI